MNTLENTKSRFESDDSMRFDVLFNSITPIASQYACRLYTDKPEKETMLEWFSGFMKSLAVFSTIFYVIFKYWDVILDYLMYSL